MTAALIGALAAWPQTTLAAPKGTSPRAGDAAWAQCVWNRAPTSAVKWLSMSIPAWRTPFTDANVLLGHRLIALCDETAANPKRPNHEPGWKRIAAALKRARPKSSGTDDPSVSVSLCQSTIAGEAKPFVYLYEIVRSAGGKEITTFQQHMAQFGDQAAKAPQDIRNVPVAGARVERSCRTIGAAGDLADA